jgi:hypothetical protein
VCIIVGKVLILLPDPQAGEIFDFISPLFGLFAVLGVYLWHRERAGTFGAVAFIVVFVGLALVTSLDFFGAFIRLELAEETRDALLDGNPGIAMAISGLTFLIGEILFSISILRAGVFPKGAAWLFMVGFVPMTLVEALPEGVVAAGSVVAGGGIIWLGLALWGFASEGRLLVPELDEAPVPV